MRYGMRAALILCLARTSRWAMVGSGTIGRWPPRRHTPKSGSGFVSEVRERAHFDRHADATRNFRRPGQGRVEIVGIDDVEPAQVLPGLGERTIGGQDLAV